MTTILTTFFLSLVVAIVVTRLTIPIGLKLGIVDKPDGYRKLHRVAVPRVGGIAIMVAFSTPLIAMLVFPELTTISELLKGRASALRALLACASLTLIVGLLDDVLNLRARWKLVFQIGIASLAVSLGFRIESITNPFGGTLELGVFGFPIAVFWFVGCMNAVNLLDGIDGLATGTCMFVGLTLFGLSLVFNNLLGMVLMSALAGAALGFLVFNFPPARIFLGDSGSLLLGFLVAALSLIASKKAEAAVALFIPVIALGLPILDTSLSIVRRWYKGLPFAEPDREHIHHFLVAMGYSTKRAVLTLYGICVVLGVSALVITVGRNEIVLLVIGMLIVTAFVSVRVFSGVRLLDLARKLAENKLRRERSSQARQTLGRAVQQFGSIGDLDGLWRVTTAAFAELEFDSLGLSLVDANGVENVRMKWQNTSEAKQRDHTGIHMDYWSRKLSLRGKDRMLGYLVASNSAADDLMIPDAADILNEFRHDFEKNVDRIVG